jgi:hypothetical protein
MIPLLDLVDHANDGATIQAVETENGTLASIFESAQKSYSVGDELWTSYTDNNTAASCNYDLYTSYVC